MKAIRNLMFTVVLFTAAVVLVTGRATAPAKPAAQPMDVVASVQKFPVMTAVPPGLAPAARDPFALTVTAPPQQAEVKVTKPAESVAPTLPAAPPLNVRFEGRMTSPSGERLIYATSGDSSIELRVGQALSNGYIVKAIDDKGVDFDYPPLGTTARLDLPPEPRQEIR